jgi:GNAT superfamily N-acetyltransferase
VYADAERGLWRDGTRRTSGAEVAELIAAGEVAVARHRDGRIVGSVHVRRIAEDTGELGMLVVAPDHRGLGIGRALVEFAERHSREQGLRAIQLELLVPRGWRHPTKEFLSSWYSRLGYRVVGVGRMDDAYPHLAPFLATPCDLQVREKPLER